MIHRLFCVFALAILVPFLETSENVRASAIAQPQTDLLYSTFFGGNGGDWIHDIAVDQSGNAYLTGATCSTDFPTTENAYDREVLGCDAFLVKFDATNTLIFSTVIGGTEENGGDGYGEYGDAIALDANGAVYIAGATNAEDFPTTPDAYDRTMDGYGDAFVAKFDTNGQLVYSNLIGGGSDAGYGTDWATDIVVNADGEAYITGVTYATNFPTTDNAYDKTYGGRGDAFLAKLDAAGTEMLYGTYLGGRSWEQANALALDASNNPIVVGTTSSRKFPTTRNAFQKKLHKRKCGGQPCGDAFVTKFNDATGGLVYSTLLGGARRDFAMAVAVNQDDAVFLTGFTQSRNFPVTQNSFDTTYNGKGYYSDDVFVLKLNPDASALEYSTFLGGAWYEAGRAIALDANGAAYVTGYTTSEEFPTTPGAFDRKCNSGCSGLLDGFFVKLDAHGNQLQYGTFLGGGGYDGTIVTRSKEPHQEIQNADPGHDWGSGIVVDENGVVSVGGGTKSDDFPTTPDAFDSEMGSYADGFLLKLFPSTQQH